MEEGGGSSSSSYWPLLAFHGGGPHRLLLFHRQFHRPPLHNNFLKAAKWAPDGSCFLVSSDDNTLWRFDLPGDSAQDDYHGDSLNLDKDSFCATVSIHEGESVYDYCWYPYMALSDASVCVFATTARDHPVHLWDAITGMLRCSYRAYDAMDELTTAYSIAFNPSGTKLFCGYNKTLRVFDTSRPGREYTEHTTFTKTKDGQTGIISCLDFNPCNSGLLAAGSFNRTAALYNEENAELLYVLHGHIGGITQVQFSKDGNYLYTGARKDPYILCWDLRYTSGIVYKLFRSTMDTNQRISFDIEPYGRHLGSGGQDGHVSIYDLQSGVKVFDFEAAKDTVNGFRFHPYLPLAVSSSGHRRFDSCEEEEQICLTGEENCASVWKFACEWIKVYDSSASCNDASIVDDDGALGKMEDQ